METSSAAFSVDADDRITNRDGYVAVQMMVKGQTRGDQRRFRFRPSALAQAVQIDWDADSEYQLFPSEITGTMVRNGYARYAPEEMLDQVNADMAEAEQDEPAPEQETEEAVDPAPKKRAGRPRKVKTDGEA